MRMVRAALVVATVCLLSLGTAAWQQAGHSGHQAHLLVTPDQVKWGPGSPALPPGAQMAVLDGDPSKPGVPFALRVKFPDGYRVPPHWHPTDENLVVLAGTFMMGVGDKIDVAAMHAMPTGAYGKMPQRTNHYAMAKGETIVQVYGVGPFELNYVNPADDPRKKK